MKQLFTYLNYDQSKTMIILQNLKRCALFSMPPSDDELIDALNKRLENNEGVEYYDENVNPLPDDTNAKYMLLDTGYVFKNGTAASVCIWINKYRGIWQGGYVQEKSSLISYAKSAENAQCSAYNRSAEKQGLIKEAKSGNKEAAKRLQEMHKDEIASLIIPESTVEAIKSDMLDRSPFWTNARIASCISMLTKALQRIVVSHLEYIHAGLPYSIEGAILNKSADKVIFNSGFMGHTCQSIYLMGSVVQKDDGVYINNVVIRPGKAAQDELGFHTDKTSPVILYRNECGDPKIEEENFDFDDRERNKHCISDRAERLPASAQSMSTEELLRKLTDSIKMAINLQNAYGGFLIPFYNPKLDDIQLLAPLYLNERIKLDNPSAAIVLGKKGKFYVPETLLSLEDALTNALVLNRYQSNIWLHRPEND